jgi:hypothetical protein
VTTPQQSRQAHEAMVQAIVQEIRRLGGWVVNPQPLQDDRLRFEVLDDQRELVLDKLGSWDWNRPCCAGSRFIPSGNGAELQPTSVYEIDVSRKEAAPKPHGSEVIDPEEWRKLLADFKAKRK